MTEPSEQVVKKQDFIHLAVLLTIALGIGVYLIATTVLIAKDGVFYIERAQNFSNDPIGIIKAHPPGYPFLIFIAHKFVGLFSNSSSTQSWIYSAQSITLLCRLLALIPLYFIGKLLVGGRKSFWAVLILVILPHSAKFGCEAIREWPFILFLSMGFLGLLIGANQPKWWILGLVGLSAGLGYLIRHESAQLLVYGFIWLTLCMFWPKLCRLSRRKIFIALALLLIGFAIPAVP
ncbi:MAG: ArnT family glycosyltransferase, partial [Planctomycetota bacterium]